MFFGWGLAPCGRAGGGGTKGDPLGLSLELPVADRSLYVSVVSVVAGCGGWAKCESNPETMRDGIRKLRRLIGRRQSPSLIASLILSAEKPLRWLL